MLKIKKVFPVLIMIILINCFVFISCGYNNYDIKTTENRKITEKIYQLNLKKIIKSIIILRK